MSSAMFTRVLACATLALAFSATAARLSIGDRTFIERAGRDGMAEYQMGKLGEQKAMRDEVRQFAARMVEDHGKANEELGHIAAARGVVIPNTPSKDQQRMQKRLGALSGPDFDREFMAMMAKDHRKAVTLFEKQARRGKDEELKTFAGRTLPTLRAHLQAAEVTRDIARMPSSPKPAAQ